MQKLQLLVSPVSKTLKRNSVLYRHLHAYAYAFGDKCRQKSSYSQWGEDKLIYDFLNAKGQIDKRWIYIDVGANHPTTISDSYLFYQHGYSGICIEPNPELAHIFSVWRPRDIVLSVAAGNKSGLSMFYKTEDPVFSSLLPTQMEDKVISSDLVPVIRLDDLIPYISANRIFMLKIDTEGFDQCVLEGAVEILRSTMVVLTETRSDQERRERAELLGEGWDIICAKANTIFYNQRLLA
jgi:FkbM family methyltransferase